MTKKEKQNAMNCGEIVEVQDYKAFGKYDGVFRSEYDKRSRFGLLRGSGNVFFNGVKFKFTVNRQNDEKRTVRVRISCVDPDTGKVLISQRKEDIYASKGVPVNSSTTLATKTFYIHSCEEKTICARILQKTKELYGENAQQLSAKCPEERLSPEMLLKGKENIDRSVLAKLLNIMNTKDLTWQNSLLGVAKSMANFR